jgi:hypothetical protein
MRKTQKGSKSKTNLAARTVQQQTRASIEVNRFWVKQCANISHYNTRTVLNSYFDHDEVSIFPFNP